MTSPGESLELQGDEGRAEEEGKPDYWGRMQKRGGSWHSEIPGYDKTQTGAKQNRRLFRRGTNALAR